MAPVCNSLSETSHTYTKQSLLAPTRSRVVPSFARDLNSQPVNKSSRSHPHRFVSPLFSPSYTNEYLTSKSKHLRYIAQYGCLSAPSSEIKTLDFLTQVSPFLPTINTSSHEVFGFLFESPRTVSHRTTATILPSEVAALPPTQSTWPTKSPLLRQSPEPSTNSNNNRLAQNPLSFNNDPVLFPTPSRPPSSARPIPKSSHSRASSASFPQPRRVSEIVHNLGYNTSPPSYNHRSASFAPASAPSLSQLDPAARQQQLSQKSPILDPHVAQKYFRRPSVSSTRVNMADRTMDPAIWGEDWPLGGQDFLLHGDFSPTLMGQDASCGNVTVSPSDIFGSVPSSDMTSPLSLFDSPADSYDHSPLFMTEDVSANWFSLFPDSAPVHEEEKPALQQMMSPMLPEMSPALPEVSSPADTDSPGNSPRFRSPSMSTKRSSVSGVRKRSQPLPPIVVEDPNDTIAMKRARNTLAARKSRAKKAERMDDMAQTIEQLQAEVEHWKRLYHEQLGAQ